MSNINDIRADIESFIKDVISLDEQFDLFYENLLGNIGNSIVVSTRSALWGDDIPNDEKLDNIYRVIGTFYVYLTTSLEIKFHIELWSDSNEYVAYVANLKTGIVRYRQDTENYGYDIKKTVVCEFTPTRSEINLFSVISVMQQAAEELNLREFMENNLPILVESIFRRAENNESVTQGGTNIIMHIFAPIYMYDFMLLYNVANNIYDNSKEEINGMAQKQDELIFDYEMPSTYSYAVLPEIYNYSQKMRAKRRAEILA